MPKMPTSKEIKKYLKKWNELENYKLQERSINLLFTDLCPENKKIEPILLKASVLNDFYSTNIFDIFTLSKHILSCNIDKCLQNNSKDIVNKIAFVKIKNKKRNFYSFASKYCSHHKPNDYPIYDYFVEKMLMFFKKEDKFYRFKKEELREYTKFVEIINSFKSFYNLDNFSLREIDIYLWLAGKYYFPKKY